MFKKLLLCAALCAVNSTVYADNIALLIGVGKYKDKANELDGPAEDVPALKKVLIAEWGFAASNIQTLIDGQATQKSILNALENLQKRSKAGDNVFIYFSGHGTSARNTNFHYVTRLLPHTSGAFLPVDFVNPQEGKKLSEQELKSSLIVGKWHLQPILKKLEQDRSIFVVMDSCYSGNGVRSLDKKVIKRQIDVLTNVADDTVEDISRSDVVDLPYPYKNVVFISASSDAEVAADMGRSDAYLTTDKKPHGAFTNALLKVLKKDAAADTNGDGQISYLEMRDATEKVIRSFSDDNGKQIYVQTPQILPSAKETSANIVYRSLFGSQQVAQTSVPQLDTMVYVQLQNGLKASEIEQINGVSTTPSSTADFIVAKNGKYYSLQTGAGDSVVKNVTIEVIRERITAEVWLKQQLKELKPSYGMRLETSKSTDLTEGNTFVFNTQVQASSYILLFSIDAHGRLSVLYPMLPHELKPVVANTLLSVPSGVADESIVVKAPFGVDTVVALALPKSFSLDDVKNIQETYVLSPNIKALEKIIKAQPTASWAQLQVRTYPKH